MSENIASITESEFDAFIESGKVVVDFWAPWCGPCRMQGQILEQAVADLENDGIKLGKVNVDQEIALASRFEVTSIPTLLIFKDGQLMNTLVGVQQAATLKKQF